MRNISGHQPQPQQQEEEGEEVVAADARAVLLPSPPRGRGRGGRDDAGIKSVAAWAVGGSSSRHRQQAQALLALLALLAFRISRRNPMRISNTI